MKWFRFFEVATHSRRPRSANAPRAADSMVLVSFLVRFILRCFYDDGGEGLFTQPPYAGR